MRIRLLGPVDVVADGASFPVNGLRRKAVLAVLALHYGEIVSNDRIADVVWAGDPPATWLNTVQRHVSYLRQVLGRRDAIVARPPGYWLDTVHAETDVAVAEGLIRQGAQVADRAHAQQLRDALALWRGEPLADVAGLPWLEEQAGRLEQLRLRASRTLAQTRLALGEHAQLVPELEVLIKDHPFDEQLYAQLMIALYRSERQADALAVYRQLRSGLRDELGIEPGQPVRDLETAILQQDATLNLVLKAAATDASPSLLERESAPVMTPRQLPRAIGDFTGRERQLRDMADMVPAAGTVASAILVLTGTAGIGKTALAVHFAHRVAARFPDGQLFMDLCGHSRTAPVPAAEVLRRFLRALGMKDAPGDAEEAAAGYRSLLAGKRMLILLDNAATADQVRPLLPGSDGCLVLVTSRSRLPGLVATESAASIAVGVLFPS
jgi:DNA-binding SARP family transcriptional activator